MLALALFLGLSATAQARQAFHVRRFQLPAGVYGGRAVEATSTITVGPDGNLWFVYGKGYGSKHVGGIGRMTPAGRVTLFPVKVTGRELVAAAGVIVTGPDGALWFTLVRYVPSALGLDEPESVNGAVGRITTAGVMTIFPLPSPVALHAKIPCKSTFLCPAEDAIMPQGLAVGPEGNLWVAGGLDSIWRVTPTGEVTTFQTPTATAWPDGITLGPNGWLWFTETSMNQFMRPPSALAYITPSGTVTELPRIHAPMAGHRVTAGLVFGSDGTLWVGGEGFISRRSSSGKVATYSMPGDLFSGTQDKAGNVWFTVSGYGFADRLAEIRRGSARPVLVGPVIPELHAGAGIAATSGGKLWLLSEGRSVVLVAVG